MCGESARLLALRMGGWYKSIHGLKGAKAMTFYTTLCTGIFIGFFLGLIFAGVVMLGKIKAKAPRLPQ
jgi:hypothetical protein